MLACRSPTLALSSQPRRPRQDHLPSPPLGAQPEEHTTINSLSYRLDDDSVLLYDWESFSNSMATISIPSPSAFLRSPIIKPAPTPRPKVTLKASCRKKSTAARHSRKSAVNPNAQSKPKQTKSRDGTCSSCPPRDPCLSPTDSTIADRRYRM